MVIGTNCIKFILHALHDNTDSDNDDDDHDDGTDKRAQRKVALELTTLLLLIARSAALRCPTAYKSNRNNFPAKPLESPGQAGRHRCCCGVADCETEKSPHAELRGTEHNYKFISNCSVHRRRRRPRSLSRSRGLAGSGSGSGCRGAPDVLFLCMHA